MATESSSGVIDVGLKHISIGCWLGACAMAAASVLALFKGENTVAITFASVGLVALSAWFALWWYTSFEQLSGGEQ